MTKGLDWSFSKPPITQMTRWGYTVAFRYISHPNPDTAPKCLTTPELTRLLAADLDVFINFEWYSTRAKEGAIAGHIDGHTAHGELVALGWPAQRIVLVSDDSFTDESSVGAVIEYLDAFQSACPGYIVEPYGNDVVAIAWHAHTGRKAWQTLAWSGGRIAPNLRAYQNGNQAFNGMCDENIVYDTSGTYKNGPPVPPPVPNPPLPFHEEGFTMFGYFHVYKQPGLPGAVKGAWKGIFIIAPDLRSKIHVVDPASAAFLTTTKLYPRSGLTDAMVEAIPTVGA